MDTAAFTATLSQKKCCYPFATQHLYFLSRMLLGRTLRVLCTCCPQSRSLSERGRGEGKVSGGTAAPRSTSQTKATEDGKVAKGRKGKAADAQEARQSDKNKYSSTVFLPTTAFPMRASAVERERELMKFSCEKLYRWQQDLRRAGVRRVIIHDGPPYANGALHIGHLLNRVLKDVIVRRHILNGDLVSFIPGWDCHGLPIELNALKQLLAKPPPPPTPASSSSLSSSSSSSPSSSSSSTASSSSQLTSTPSAFSTPASPASTGVSVIEVAANSIASKDPRSVRSAAQALARATIQQHLVETDRWHLAFDSKSIYTTMDPQYEAAQLRVFGTMLQKGLVFRGLRPVHWSPSSRTALAEAELEYNDAHMSCSVHVAFDLDVAHVSASHAPLIQRLASSGISFSCHVSFVAWTTTPWTLPANQALCLNDKFEYAFYACKPSGEGLDGPTRSGIIILLSSKAELLRDALGLVGSPLASVLGAELVGMPYIHPMTGQRHRVLHAAFVTAEVGTGIVHTAPAHGFDDYDIGVSSGLLCSCLVDDDGRYTQEAGPSLHGKSVLDDGASAVMQMLHATGHLLSRSNYVHKCLTPLMSMTVPSLIASASHANRYPYDWRTKLPVIIRTTEQVNACLALVSDHSPDTKLAVVCGSVGAALCGSRCTEFCRHGPGGSALPHDGLLSQSQPLVHQPPEAVGCAHPCSAQHSKWRSLVDACDDRKLCSNSARPQPSKSGLVGLGPPEVGG
jgi:isoleucyl-tRNA synthetase